MKNCRDCNNVDVCGGKFSGLFPCPDFVAKKAKINHSKIRVNRCDVCGKELKANAELCSACRKPYDETKAKFPHLLSKELLKMTREIIAEKKQRVIEKRNMERKHNGNTMQRL